MSMAPMGIHWPVGIHVANSCLLVCEHNEFVKRTAVIQYSGVIPKFCHQDGGHLTFEVPVQKIEIEVGDMWYVGRKKWAGWIDKITICDSRIGPTGEVDPITIRYPCETRK